MNDSLPPPASAPQPAAGAAPGARSPAMAGLRGALGSPMAVVVAVLALLFAWHWYDSGVETRSLRDELAKRLRDSDSDSRDAKLVARQAQDTSRELQAKLAQIEGKLAESQSQQVALEAMYQELSRNRDEWVLAEIEQILTIASQQLQLAGNVSAALAALQTADSRLTRGDRPQFLPLRKVLSRDIERLKNASSVDVAGIALKLDQAIASVDALPLAYDARVSGESRPVAAEGFWQRLGQEVLGEFRQMVRIQSLKNAEPPLLSPSHAFFLRENLKLRLLNARLALLSRDQSTYREDLRTAQAWMARYFDPRARANMALGASLKALSSGAAAGDMPTIAESLAAVRNQRFARERTAR
jgi:uroporphyrin-3 C-methyltransferase